MAVAADTTRFTCPQCSTQLEAARAEHDRRGCVSCGWKGTVLLFRPVSPPVEHAKAALPADATCVHHPVNRAVEVCAGTGDYICSLCSIEIDGTTYSAQHIDSVGADKIGKAFDRHLIRPDSTVVLYLLLCFVPYVNFIWIIGTPAWVVLGFRKLLECTRLRAEDALMARLISTTRLVVLGVLLGLFGLVFLISVLLIIVGLLA
jgi:ribosomal protein L37AE/L43A